MLLLSCGKFTEIAWYRGPLASAQVDAGDRIIMLDFYTEWWSWCKRLDADTFPDERVIDFLSSNMLSYKIDAEKGEGPELKDRYAVSGFPTIIFLRNDGSEVDRIVGYLPPDRFLAEIKRIQAGTNTLESMRNAHEASPEDLQLALTLANKYGENHAKARRIWEKIAQLSEVGTREKHRADFKIAQIKAIVDKDPGKLIEFANSNSESPFLGSAYSILYRIYHDTKDVAKEADVFRKYVDLAIAKNMASSSLLSSYALRMAQFGLNLDNALDRIRIALEMASSGDAKSRAQLMDTEAEILWKMGRNDDAIAVIDDCIKLQPHDEYYKEQRAKFLEGKTAA